MKKSVLFVFVLCAAVFCFDKIVAVAPLTVFERLSSTIEELSARSGSSAESSVSTLFHETFSGWDPVLIDTIGKFIKGEEIPAEHKQRYGKELKWMQIIDVVLSLAQSGDPYWAGTKKFQEFSLLGNPFLNLTARYLMLLEILKAVIARYPNKETDQPTILSYASGGLLFEYILAHLLLNHLQYRVVNLHVIDPLYAKWDESAAIQTFVNPKRLRMLRKVNMPGFRFEKEAKKSLNLVVWQSAFNYDKLDPPPEIFIMIRPFARSRPQLYAGQKPIMRPVASINDVEEQIFYLTQKMQQSWYVGNGEKRDEGFFANYISMTSWPFVRTNLTGVSLKQLKKFLNDQKGGEKFVESIRSTTSFVPGLIVQFFELARKFGSRKSFMIAWGPWPAIGRVATVNNLQRPLQEIAADFYPDDTIYP